MNDANCPPGLRIRDGNWHYRVKHQGREWAGNTGLVATKRNVGAALSELARVREAVRSGQHEKLAIREQRGGSGLASLRSNGSSELILFIRSRRTPWRSTRLGGADPQPAWLGYSVGHWEGDTLVVDTAGFNDKSWLDAAGHPHSEALQVEERFRRRDFGHLDVQVTVDDPKMYTKPITVKVTELLIPDSDVLENFCNENEKDRPHLPGPPALAQ